MKISYITISPRDKSTLGSFHEKLVTYHILRYCTFYTICSSVWQSYSICSHKLCIPLNINWFWLNGVLLIYSPGCCFSPLSGHKYGLVAFLCILILFSIQFPISTVPGRECIYYTCIFMTVTSASWWVELLRLSVYLSLDGKYPIITDTYVQTSIIFS